MALLELLGLCGIDLAEEQDVRDARGGENLRQRLLLGIARLGDADEVGALEALAEAAFIVGAQPSAALLGIEREGQFALGVDSNMEGSGRFLAAGEAAAADFTFDGSAVERSISEASMPSLSTTVRPSAPSVGSVSPVRA